MTAGTKLVDQRVYLAGGTGPWVGTYLTKNWLGDDYGVLPLYNRATDHVIEVVGLGAGHAREIFHELAEDAREQHRALKAFERSGNRNAYERRVAESAARKAANLKASYERHMSKLALVAADRERHKAEKAWRKLHGIPFPKEMLRGKPPRDFIPKLSMTLKVPSRSSPKSPKRESVEDHPYTMDVTEIHAVKYSLTSQVYPTVFIDQGSTNSINILGGPTNTTLLTANDQIKLVNKLREQLQGSDFNASVFLAEGHRTARLIGDVAIRLAKFYYHVRRGDFYGCARSLLEGTSRAPLRPRRDTWGQASNDLGELGARVLEFQYGIKPLLKDVYAGSEQLAFLLNHPGIKTYRVGVRQETNQVGSRLHRVQVKGVPPNEVTDLYVTHKQRLTQSHKRNLIARIEEKDLPTLPQALGLMDPELIVWEVIPFSFVADWFCPIGPYLEARSTANRLRGTFVTSDKKNGLMYPVYGPYMSTPECRGTRLTVFSRTVSNVLAVPMPTVKTLKQAGTFQHILNGVALLASAVLGKTTIR